MKSVLIFFSLVILLALLGASGAATHAVFAKAVATGSPMFRTTGFILFVHLLAACILTGLAAVIISAADNKS